MFFPRVILTNWTTRTQSLIASTASPDLANKRHDADTSSSATHPTRLSQTDIFSILFRMGLGACSFISCTASSVSARRCSIIFVAASIPCMSGTVLRPLLAFSSHCTSAPSTLLIRSRLLPALAEPVTSYLHTASTFAADLLNNALPENIICNFRVVQLTTTGNLVPLRNHHCAKSLPHPDSYSRYLHLNQLAILDWQRANPESTCAAATTGYRLC